MKTYIIPVSWIVTAEMTIGADSLEKAMEQADRLSLPTETSYVDGSFVIDKHILSAVNLNEEVLKEIQDAGFDDEEE